MSDTIYRDDAVNAVCKGCVKENPHCRHHWDCPMLTNLGKLPSVDRPSGEWVPFEYGDERWHKCTACGVADKYIEYVERPNGTTGKLVAIRNFCPNCGADMRGNTNERHDIQG